MIISEELLHQVIEVLIMYRLREREEINTEGLSVLCQLQTDYTRARIDDIIEELSELRNKHENIEKEER